RTSPENVGGASSSPLHDDLAVPSEPMKEALAPFWSHVGRSVRSGPARLTIYAIAAAALVAGVGFGNSDPIKRALGFARSADSTQYAIIPLTGDSRSSEALAANATDKLYNAFRAWNGLRIVPDLKVDE